MSALEGLRSFKPSRITAKKNPPLREEPEPEPDPEPKKKTTKPKPLPIISLLSDDEDDNGSKPKTKKNFQPSNTSTSTFGNRPSRSFLSSPSRVRLDQNNEFLLSNSNRRPQFLQSTPTPRRPAIALDQGARGGAKASFANVQAAPSPTDDDIIFVDIRKAPGRNPHQNVPILIQTDVPDDTAVNSSQLIRSRKFPRTGLFRITSDNNDSSFRRSTKNAATKSTSTHIAPQGTILSTSTEQQSSLGLGLQPVAQRSLPFFWAHKDSFLPLLDSDPAFFTNLGKTNLQDAAVPYCLLDQPTGIRTAQLKDYQLKGLSWLVCQYRNGMPGILADEMGLGKTLQILSLFQYLKESELNRTHTHLVVCPTSVLSTWHTEASKFTPQLSVLKIRGSPENRKNQMSEYRKSVKSKTPFDLVITTYPTFSSEKSFFSRIGSRLTYLVLDEGHTVKNDLSELTDRARRVKAELKLVVTGTPLQNNLVELWTILNILLPHVFTRKTKATFQDAFDISHGTADPRFLDDVVRLLDVIMLRRDKNTKGIDLKLPPKNVIYLSVPLSPLQRQAYMSVLGSLAHSEGGSAIAQSVQQQNRKALQNLLVKLRQVCSHPFLCEDETLRDNNLVHASSKFILIEKLLAERITRMGGKVIIFSEWLDVLDLIGNLLSSEGINGQKYKFLRLDGSTPSAKRNLVIDRFQRSSDYRIILISITAGGQGITLTAATSVIILEDNWNPQVTLQAEARAHRLGQDDPVTVYKIYTSGTVEEQMLGRIQKKIYLAEKVTNSTQNIYTSLDANANHDGSPDSQRNDEDVRLNTSQLRNMIKRGTSLKNADKFRPAEMIGWTFEQMMKECQHHDVSQAAGAVDEPLTEEEEQQWLSEMEKVNCSNFEGKVIKRKTKWMVDHVDTNLDPRDRRKDKERAVEVDGYWISKQSMLCKPGEAVPALISEPSTGMERDKNRRKTWINEAHCHKCKASSGVLVKCADCPRSFHSDCAGYLPSKGVLHCPQHKCADCNRGIPDIGGMIYSCRRCENAWCEDCLDLTTVDHVGDSLSELEELGFYNSREAFWYILCSTCANLDHLTLPDVGDSSSELSTLPRLSLSSEIGTPRTSQTSEFSTPRMDGSPNTPSTSTSLLTRSCKRKFSSLGLEQDDDKESDIVFEPSKRLFN